MVAALFPSPPPLCWHPVRRNALWVILCSPPLPRAPRWPLSILDSLYNTWRWSADAVCVFSPPVCRENMSTKSLSSFPLLFLSSSPIPSFFSFRQDRRWGSPRKLVVARVLVAPRFLLSLDFDVRFELLDVFLVLLQYWILRADNLEGNHDVSSDSRSYDNTPGNLKFRAGRYIKYMTLLFITLLRCEHSYRHPAEVLTVAVAKLE